MCERCQDAALADDSGSDDEVVSDSEEEASGPPQDDGDPAFAEVSDQRLLRELARRLGDEASLAEEEREKTEDRRN